VAVVKFSENWVSPQRKAETDWGGARRAGRDSYRPRSERLEAPPGERQPAGKEEAAGEGGGQSGNRLRVQRRVISINSAKARPAGQGVAARKKQTEREKPGEEMMQDRKGKRRFRPSAQGVGKNRGMSVPGTV